ncbi:TrmH family RNA methyltransferase [bacterium]|nr:MAG: TrmH family RNA methyltransferase [bacterium]
MSIEPVRKLSTKEIFTVNKSRTKENVFHETVVILDNIRSMHNVGSFFRTCDAFGTRKLFLTGITPTPPRPEISKSALGADEHVNWEYSDSILVLMNELKENGYLIIGIEQTTNSELLHHFNPKFDQKVALIFGNEVSGVDATVLQHCDLILEIPQFGNKHSFNVSVSFGIVCYALFERFHKPL